MPGCGNPPWLGLIADVIRRRGAVTPTGDVIRAIPKEPSHDTTTHRGTRYSQPHCYPVKFSLEALAVARSARSR